MKFETIINILLPAFIWLLIGCSGTNEENNSVEDKNKTASNSSGMMKSKITNKDKYISEQEQLVTLTISIPRGTGQGNSHKDKIIIK